MKTFGRLTSFPVSIVAAVLTMGIAGFTRVVAIATIQQRGLT